MLIGGRGRFGRENGGEKSLWETIPFGMFHIVEDLGMSEACCAENVSTSPAMVAGNRPKKSKWRSAEHIITNAGMGVGLPLRTRG